MKLSERLEALLASDDWNSQLSFSIKADELVREAAELARRVETAPVCEIYTERQYPEQYFGTICADGLSPEEMEKLISHDGASVAIVKLEVAS